MSHMSPRCIRFGSVRLLLTVFAANVFPLHGFVEAEVQLPRLVSSGMVLQRDSEVTLWGWAAPAESVRIKGDWLADELTVVASATGEWQTKLRTGKDSSPHQISIRGTNEKTLTDIRFGEVWIASGQSNMEMPLRKVSGAYTGVLNGGDEIAQAKHPLIRLFQVGNFASKEPVEDAQFGNEHYGIPPAECRWRACSPETVANFSSTAYFFARELHRHLDVPIGVVDASWGATNAEAWTPRNTLSKLGYDSELKLEEQQPQDPNQKLPSRLYNGMIAPLTNMTIRGVIWYQGEGNCSRADQYRELFTSMIGSWRKEWSAEFPFYFVQIAPYRYPKLNSAFLREAQTESLELANTGMVCTLDIGDIKDIHPKNKQEVGRRLALLALEREYRERVDGSGPLFREFKREGDALRIFFDRAENGLRTRDGRPPAEFQIANADHKWFTATARIDNGTVVVSSPRVQRPTAVRHAFTNTAQPNLTDGSGLPATSFRTDR